MANAPSFPEILNRCTARLEALNEDQVIAYGTGFIFTFHPARMSETPAIITNRHVLADATGVRFHLTNTKSEHVSFEVAICPELSLDHPDPQCDLQLVFVGPAANKAREEGHLFNLHALGPGSIPSREYYQSLNSAEEVLMVGYPVGLRDEVNNFPLFRRGITASQPGIDWNGLREFVIDAACYPGSSGSPVLLYHPGLKVGGGLRGGRPVCKLLGVLWGGPQHQADGKIEVVPVPTTLPVRITSQVPMNLGYVIRADRIMEFEPLIEALLREKRT